VSREVILRGEIRSEIIVRASAELTKLEHQSYEPISLLINSPGGDTKPARELSDLIKNLISPVYALVTHQALSAGFIILQACIRRVAMEGASFMFHAPGFTATEAYAISGFPCDEDMRFDDDEQYLAWLGYLSQRSGAPVELLALLGTRIKRVQSAIRVLRLKKKNGSIGMVYFYTTYATSDLGQEYTFPSGVYDFGADSCHYHRGTSVGHRATTSQYRH